MAEGFARKYGSDVLNPNSAGIAPAPIVQPETVRMMSQKNIDIREQFPKNFFELEIDSFDLIINMSGHGLPVGLRGEVVVWEVVDPMAQSEEVYTAVRDRIEGLVMQLILDLRRTKKGTARATKNTNPTPRLAKTTVLAEPAAKVDSGQRFGFGRVRRARD